MATSPWPTTWSPCGPTAACAPEAPQPAAGPAKPFSRGTRRTAMRGAVQSILLALLLALPLAGCFAARPPDGGTLSSASTTSPGPAAPVGYACQASLLFQFVDYGATDR